MNVVFISPSFPPQFENFCVELKKRSVNVLGLGDAPASELTGRLSGALGEYYQCPALGNSYADAHRALAYLSWKHGRIDRVESLNEHWLGLEAQLREDFNIPGPRPEQIRQQRSKTGMAELYTAAGVPCPEGELVTSSAQVKAFAKRVGYLLVFKPDLGVGAARTFKVSTAKELDEVLAQPLEGYLVQPFITGQIVTYDGLTDREGRIVFETGHVYGTGIMDVVNERADVAYWSVREIPPGLAEVGKKTVKAFGLVERFFHSEFFLRPDGSYMALEINLRPPGGFTTDMMNYSADIDVYELWARLLTGEDVSGFSYRRTHHVAHVSRRAGRRYRLSHEEVLRELGARLLWHRHMPPVLSGAMGDEVYMVRTPDFAVLHKDIERVQALA